MATSSPSRLRGGAIAALLALCLAPPKPAAAAEGARFALLVQGASGGEPYAVLHRKWLDGLISTLGRFQYDGEHLIVLSEQPKTGEERSTADNVRAAFARLATRIKAGDQLLVVLIGHGGGEGADAKFNLVGPDLSVQDWNALTKPLPGRLAFVNTTGASFPYLAGLAGKDRVVITATSSYSQRFDTQFPEGFVQALSSPDADLDKDGRISLQEAFIFATRSVKQYYEQKNLMAIESAVLDDSGTGKGRDATALATAEISAAGLTYIQGIAIQASSDPETQRLIARQQALTEQLDELRRQKASMPADQYDKQFESLMLELATVSRDVRQKTGR